LNILIIDFSALQKLSTPSLKKRSPAKMRRGAAGLVNVDFAFLEKKAVPVNITLPVWLRDRIDKAAKDTGVTRSRFIAQAAQEAMRHM